MSTYHVATFDLSTLGTDAGFRALWGAVDTQLQGLGGWTYVAQTGDSDPAAATAGSNGTYPSWRVYQTTVAGQDWFLRLDYGHDANGPAIKHQVGTTVNGSGVLGSQKNTQVNQLLSSGFGAGATRSVYMAQASGRMFLAIGDLGRGSSICFAYHADVDSSGANTNTGMQEFNAGQFSFGSQPTPASGFIPTAENQIPCNYTNAGDNQINGKVITGHPFLFTDVGGLNITPAVAIGGTTNFSTGNTTTISLYGVSRTFLITAHTSPNGVTSAQSLLFLFD